MAGSNPLMLDEYGSEISQIERRRKLAELLQGQSMQPIEQQQTGRFAVPISPFQGAAKLAQAYVGALGQRKADEEVKNVAGRYQTDLAATLARAMQARGKPAGFSEDAAGNVTPTPATSAGQEQISIFGSHPATAGIAVQLAGQDASRQRLIQALTGGAAQPSGGGQPPQPGAAQRGAPQAGMGGPAGGVPMEAWLAVDPSGKTYMEQLAKDATEASKPVVNRGFGIGRMVNGQYVPDKASLDQALSMERGRQSITAPMEPPVTMKLSGGQEVQLSRPEYAEFQKTNQLPARYGQQGVPSAPASAPSAAPAPAAPTSGGLGVPGLTEPESERVKRESQLAANREAGKEFIAEMRQNYSKLRDVPATLENIEKAKANIPNASVFMGPLGQAKLEATKFFRSNLGMNVNLDNVKDAEQLRSQLFIQVMDNLKKMDAQPSTYQQQVMEKAFGTLGTDPAAVPAILDTFGDILRSRVDIHNQTVQSAKQSGTLFPYDVTVKLKPKGAANLVKDVVNSTPQPSGIQKPPPVSWKHLGR